MAGSKTAQFEGKDFDALLKENRTFQIGGQMFTWRYVGWREWSQWVDAAANEAVEEEEAEKAAKESGEEVPEAEQEPLEKQLEQVVDRICRYLIPADVDRFRALALEGEVPWLQLSNLRDWLQEVQIDLPTEQP